LEELLFTDVLIIGSGVAGGIAALELADSGVHVTIVSRGREPQDGSTWWAQGGIVYRGREDSTEALQEDIIQAGAGHSYPPAVRIIAGQGPALVKQLLIDKLQIVFDHNERGELDLAREGGHHIPRIVHVADATGKAISSAIYRRLQDHPNIRFLTNFTAVDLLTPAHHSLNRLDIYQPASCVGAYLLDQLNDAVVRCIAKKTILATGGLGQIYLRTTNPAGARGDGIAMAYRAGARVINAEFVQFHPTMFYREYGQPFLISEALRGAGARLVDADGRPFMQKYNAEWKDLAPRDIVAASIHKEMLERGLSNVFLDACSHIPEQRIKSEFPNIYSQCLANGVDITKDLIPVVPAAHYFCGGVAVDGWGQTNIQNFYAVGEVSCTGVHGANRLASTSLLEGLVWGVRSAQHIRKTLNGQSYFPADNIPPWEDMGTYPPDPALIHQDIISIKHIMWNYVGLVRTKYRLQRAIRELRSLENEIERFYRVTRLKDSLIGLRNAVRTAIIVTTAAWENKRSMGCHLRE